MEIGTWAGLRVYLSEVGASVQTLQDRTGESYRCTRSYPGGPQLYNLAPTTIPSGAVWLGIAALVGTLERFAMRAALVANGELAIGSLALADGRVILRQTLPLAGLLSAQLDVTMSDLAQLAAELRAAPQDEDAPFGYVFR